MLQLGRCAPATIRRALFVFALLTRALAAGPGVTPPTSLAQVGLPDAAEAQRILSQFRQSGIAGQYYLEFELHQLPRQGDETVLRGKLWGSQNGQGAITRIFVNDATGREHRLLLQNGPRAAAWRWVDGHATPLAVTEQFAAIVPGVELSAFDVQMPFLFWADAKVVSIERIHERPAYAFVFRPAAAFATEHPAVATVRSYFDTQFTAPVKTELLDREERVTKTFSLLDVKKVGAQYIPKAFEVRDETSRNKTRLVVTAAALNLELADRMFTPDALGENVRPPGADRLVQIDP